MFKGFYGKIPLIKIPLKIPLMYIRTSKGSTIGLNLEEHHITFTQQKNEKQCIKSRYLPDYTWSNYIQAFKSLSDGAMEQ